MVQFYHEYPGHEADPGLEVDDTACRRETLPEIGNPAACSVSPMLMPHKMVDRVAPR